MSMRVTDKAAVEWLEIAGGYDTSGLKRDPEFREHGERYVLAMLKELYGVDASLAKQMILSPIVLEAMGMGASAVTVDGVTYHFGPEDGAVVRIERRRRFRCAQHSGRTPIFLRRGRRRARRSQSDRSSAWRAAAESLDLMEVAYAGA